MKESLNRRRINRTMTVTAEKRRSWQYKTSVVKLNKRQKPNERNPNMGQITHEPSKIRLSVDVENYRRDFDDTSKPAKKEIKENLKRRNGTKYPDTAPDFVFKMLD